MSRHRQFSANLLEDYAAHLLDGFLALRAKHALLVPMISDKALGKAFTGPGARGFESLRYWLYLSCVTDIVKLTVDDRTESASIQNIITGLSRPTVFQEVKERTRTNRSHYANADEDDGLDILAALEKMEVREETERLARFEADYASVKAMWLILKSSASLKFFKRIRNEIAAHHTTHQRDGRFLAANFKTLGITPSAGDLETVLSAMQEIVELLGNIVRRAGFAWDSVGRNTSKAAAGFWAVHCSRL